jgi:hypothetical protein
MPDSMISRHAVASRCAGPSAGPSDCEGGASASRAMGNGGGDGDAGGGGDEELGTHL